MGGLVMPIPALAYGLLERPRPLVPDQPAGGDGRSGDQRRDRGPARAVLSWRALVLAIVIHATFSVTFGLLFGVVSPTLPPIPGGPVIAGGVLMPLLWTGLCYGFMGIINPLLQAHVNWPWFIASQVVYGLAMSIVVVNSEKVPVPPAGSGPDCRPVPRSPARAEVIREFARHRSRDLVRMPPSLDVAGPARRLRGRLRPPRPAQGRRSVRAARRTKRSFDVLFRQNCVGCHGADGKLGPGTSAERQAVPGPDSGRRNCGASSRKDGPAR